MKDSRLHQDIIDRNCETWCEKIREGVSRINILPIPSHFGSRERSHIGACIFSLLGKLLYVSGGTVTSRQMRYSPISTNLTPSDYLILCGLVLDIPITITPRFPVYESSQLRDTLRTSGLAGTEQVKSANEHQISEWIEYLKRSLPIATPDLIYNSGLALDEKILTDS